LIVETCTSSIQKMILMLTIVDYKHRILVSNQLDRLLALQLTVAN